jgi:rod shape determining protein RodA
MNKIFLYIKKADWILFIAVLLLLIFGLAEIYSIALGNDEINLLNFKKQAVFIIIGLIIFFAITFIDYSNLKGYANYLYIVSVILLLAVLFFGTNIRGTTGWFSVFGLGIQPIEIVKVILLLFLAKYFSDYYIGGNIKKLVISGLSVLFLVVLAMFQPDFGSAMILFAVWFLMLFIIGMPIRYLTIIVSLTVVVFLFSWFFFFEDYQRDRIMTLLRPEENSLSGAYNVNQAMIAVGSGRLIGRGIGFGSQSQLKFLPESQNDFIFAVIAEELGLMGVLMVISFFALIFYRLISSALKMKDIFSTYLLCGAAGLIFVQMFINIGMNIGLVPVIGISLPFVSYGGSAIISALILMGIVQNVIIHNKLKY